MELVNNYMPYRSKAQERYFNANRAKLEAHGVDVGEWNRASKGKKLPMKKNKGEGKKEEKKESKKKEKKENKGKRGKLDKLAEKNFFHSKHG